MQISAAGVAQSSCLTAKVKVLSFHLVPLSWEAPRDPTEARVGAALSLLTFRAQVITNLLVCLLDSVRSVSYQVCKAATVILTTLCEEAP